MTMPRLHRLSYRLYWILFLAAGLLIGFGVSLAGAAGMHSAASTGGQGMTAPDPASPPLGCWNVDTTYSAYQPSLFAVAARATNDVWAAGDVGETQTLIMHWDGTQWSRVTSPNP